MIEMTGTAEQLSDWRVAPLVTRYLGGGGGHNKPFRTNSL